MITAFAPHGPVVLALDDTIERRRGKRITAKGIYRDPVRSSDSHFVKASGLRWMSLMLLAPVPWAGRVWRLPFLTALVPPSAPAASEAGATSHRSTSGASSPCKRGAGCQGATSCRSATAASRPCYSLCDAPQRRDDDHAPAA